MMVELRFQSVG